jgi:transposase-like protein
MTNTLRMSQSCARLMWLLAQGQTGADVARVLGVTETTYYRWRSAYGGLKGD